ncbi:hypothetical protein [Micromonospora haikouensis]|uniref:hypothetical protein n=1 Tax=Micromonospora haikouensis TaxID=686309 RepID=UPI0011876027|nr:hypothetical protein [Micromonospora haikouensis]
MAWENVATLVIALAALVVSGVSAGYSKRSADASKRSADAAERQAAAAEAAIPPPPPTVAWQVLPGRGKNSYVLRNVGTQTAVNVEVDKMNSVLRPIGGSGLDVAELAPGESIRFLVLTSMQLPTLGEINVRWKGSGGWVIVPLP